MSAVTALTDWLTWLGDQDGIGVTLTDEENRRLRRDIETVLDQSGNRSVLAYVARLLHEAADELERLADAVRDQGGNT